MKLILNIDEPTRRGLIIPFTILGIEFQGMHKKNGEEVLVYKSREVL